MSGAGKITLVVRWAWWWPVYWRCLLWVAVQSGREPDWDKFMRLLYRAMRLRVGKSD